MRQSNSSSLLTLLLKDMKYCFSILILAVVLVDGTACEQTKVKQKPERGTEPRTSKGPVTDYGPPLLLDDNSDVNLPDNPVADNSRCYVCHLNYAQEKLAVTHARANIGCANCHGDCDAHIADESWASGGNGTPPGIMYPPEKVNPFCMGCHTKDKIDVEQHKPLFAGTAEKKYCTDCHGAHRLAHRKCKWR
jgi:hypothetical protein